MPRPLLLLAGLLAFSVACVAGGEPPADGGAADGGGPTDVALEPEAATTIDVTRGEPDADPCGSALLGGACTTPDRICGSERCAQACGFCTLLRCDGATWRRLEVPPPQQPCDAGSSG